MNVSLEVKCDSGDKLDVMLKHIKETCPEVIVTGIEMVPLYGSDIAQESTRAFHLSLNNECVVKFKFNGCECIFDGSK